MPPSENERLAHMRDLAREAITIAGNRTLDEGKTIAFYHWRSFTSSRSSARRRPTSPNRGASFPEIPWRDVIDTRNRLIHGYHDTEIEIVYSIVRNDLPPLVAALERAAE